MQHCVNMSSVENSLLRIAVTAPTDPTADVNAIITEAKGLGSQNIALVAPGEVQFTVEDENGVAYTKWGSAIYAAAAVAGMFANPNRRLATPLTRKSLTDYGIYDVSDYYTKQDIMQLSANGVTVLVKNKDSNLVKVNQGVTTDTKNFASYYLNVVCCKYEVTRLLQNDLDETFIGTEIDSGTPTSIANFLSQKLDGMKGIYLNDWRELKVNRDASIPTKVNASVKMVPLWGLDYIDLAFTVVAQ